MRWSKSYIPTLKEAPGDAEVISHKLLLRAGLIRKLTAGVYTWLPLGLRALKKAEQIVREEFNNADANEILMPSVQPADLWIESGRWTKYGKELLRFVDRHEHECCLGPTHEEVVTDLIRGEIRSYRQLPLNLYQIQGKFRDEIRPRFGLMRGREFVMADAYSFDRDRAGLDVSYEKMFEAYMRIFKRMNLKFRPVEADCGSIGGNSSHEFMVLAETGEDTISYCTQCNWASNVERAAVVCNEVSSPAECPAMSEMPTPSQHTIEELSAFLKLGADRLIKTLLFEADGKPVAVLLRGDRELNEVKLKNLLNADSIEFAAPEKVQAWTHAEVGFAGPVRLSEYCPNIRIIVDMELKNSSDMVVGGNKTDTHIMHVRLDRDVNAPLEWADIRLITDGDKCPHCGGKIGFAKGIEVGHVFKLGTKYSEALHAVYLDEQGKEQTIIMGCYGIGVSRVVAACIEQCNDGDGIAFPPPLAPCQVMLVCLDPKKEDVLGKSEELMKFFESEGLDVLLDDREERPGVKFKDADLLGFPYQVVVGGKGLSRGVIEVKNRKTGEKSELPVESFAEAFRTWRASVLKSWE